MPSKDTVNYRITKKTKDEIEKWRSKLAKALGIHVKEVRLKDAEIAMRVSSKRGSVTLPEINDIILGRIK